MRNKIKHLLIFLFGAILFFVQINNISISMPGQNIEEMTIWTGKNAFLSKLEKVIDKINNETSYLSFFKDDQHSFFAFYTDRKGIVDTEIIAVAEGSSTDFWAEKSDKSFEFLSKFYNPEISTDFKESKFIYQSSQYKYKDKNEDASVKIYKGKMFVYICEEHSSFNKNMNKFIKSSNFKLTPVNYVGSTLQEFKKFFK